MENKKSKRYMLVKELWSFMSVHKKWWLLLIVVLLLLTGVLIILGQRSVVSPFTYVLF